MVNGSSQPTALFQPHGTVKYSTQAKQINAVISPYAKKIPVTDDVILIFLPRAVTENTNLGTLPYYGNKGR